MAPNKREQPSFSTPTDLQTSQNSLKSIEIRMNNFLSLSNIVGTFAEQMAQILKILGKQKKGEFLWSSLADKAFKEIKERMATTPVLRHPNFSKVFEVAWIGGVLSLEGCPIAFFSEKLKEAKQKYSTYDKKFYVVV